MSNLSQFEINELSWIALGNDNLASIARAILRLNGSEGTVETQFNPATLKHGLYKIYWLTGGDSVASVGSNSHGDRWFAPTNWIAGLPCYDWSKVKAVERIA